MIYIGLGSNLGNRIQNIENAKYLLKSYGIDILKSSSYYETLSWPDTSNPKFINIIIESNTNIPADRLIKIFKLIEKKLGRRKGPRNSPRTCDIDLISYRDKIFLDKIKIPHKRMSKRNFVLLPLFEIAPDWIHPITKKSVKDLIFSLPIKDITTIKQI